MFHFVFVTTLLISSFFLYSDQKLEKKPLTFAQTVFVGGCVGAGEVLFPGHLLSYWVAQKVAKKSFILENSYRGCFANMVGQFPVTAAEQTVYVFGSNYIKNKQNKDLSVQQKFALSAFGGAAASLIDTPSNSIQLYQQNEKHLKENSWNVCKARGMKLYRGFTPNTTKEILFAAGYQTFAPVCQQSAKNYLGDNPAATVVGGIFAGVVTAFVTLPANVMRLKMQQDFDEKIYTTTGQTVKKIFKDDGLKGFFAGGKGRVIRIAVAVPLYTSYTRFLTKNIEKISE